MNSRRLGVDTIPVITETTARRHISEAKKILQNPSISNGLADATRTNLNLAAKSLLAQGEVLPPILDEITTLIRRLDQILGKAVVYRPTFEVLTKKRFEHSVAVRNIDLLGFLAARSKIEKCCLLNNTETTTPATINQILHIIFSTRSGIENCDLGWVLPKISRSQFYQLAHDNFPKGNKNAQGLLWRIYRLAEVARREASSAGLLAPGDSQITLITETNCKDEAALSFTKQLCFEDEGEDFSRRLGRRVIKSGTWLHGLILPNTSKDKMLRGGRPGLWPSRLL